MRILFVLCVLAVLWRTPVLAAEKGCEIVERNTEREALFRFDVRPNEEVFTAKLSGLDSEAFPLAVMVFSDRVVGFTIDFGAVVKSPDQSDDGEWHVHFGSIDDEESRLMVGFGASSEEGEKPTPIVCTKLPVKRQDVEVYYIPYRVVGQKTDALLVAISKDREAIKETVKTSESMWFDWEKSAKEALLTPDVNSRLKRAKKERAK